MKIGEAKTSVSSIEIDGRGLIIWRYLQDAEVGLEEAQEEVRVTGDLVEELLNGRSWLLIDIRKIRSIDRAARKLFASDWVSDTYGVQALALVIGSPVSCFIGNFWQTIHKPKHPTRLFTDEEKALEWLTSMQN